MTTPSYGSSNAGEGQYGSPAGQQPPPGYQQPGQQGYPQGYPQQGYQQPGYQQPGQPGYPPAYGSYPQAGYPGANPYAPAGPIRPGTVIASAVIGYILAVFLFLAGIFTLAGASTVDDIAGFVGTSVDTGTFVLLGLADIVIGGLLIAGGVSVTSGKMAGRTMTTAAAVLTLLCSIGWLTFDGSAIAWGIGFTAPAILATVFLWQAPTQQWLLAKQGR